MTNEAFARVKIDALLAAQGRDVLDTNAAFLQRVQSGESIVNQRAEALNKAMATFDAILSRTFSGG